MTLVEFLLARIAEDERTVVAILRRNPHWAVDGADVVDGPTTVLAYARGDYAATHIARWDPARVLAECDAKRRVVAGWDAWDQEWIARVLAAVYADHPDYNPSWAPERVVR